jgi:hypothetical protein
LRRRASPGLVADHRGGGTHFLLFLTVTEVPTLAVARIASGNFANTGKQKDRDIASCRFPMVVRLKKSPSVVGAPL